MSEEFGTVLEPRALPDFVETKFVKALTERAMGYITAGFPVHFRGASGTGKTTLAFHLASKIGRPVVLMHGDEEFTTSNLVGGENGYRFRKVIDRFVSRVLKVEEDMVKRWVDNRLTIACKYGFTLIYDEFTRSRPEANNVLLSVLEEKLLALPSMPSKSGYVRVHPDFHALFTSNPEDYVGVHKSQDALLDRMITIDLEYFDRETEVAITAARAGIPRADGDRIVDLVRGFRASGQYEIKPTVRKCIMIGKVMVVRRARASAGDPIFRRICLDVLGSEPMFSDNPAVRSSQQRNLLEDLVDQNCPPEGLPAWEELTPPAPGGNGSGAETPPHRQAMAELATAG